MEAARRQWARDWLGTAPGNYIARRFREGRSECCFEVKNPWDQSDLVSFRMASASDVDDAVQAANRCFRAGTWARRPMRERARIMRDIGELARQHRAELATLETLCNGKTYREAYDDDLPDCGDIFDYYAGWIGKHHGDQVPVEDGLLNYTVKEPLGVCGLIVPWNFPLLMACWKLAPALAAGNSVVIKPSEFTSLSLVRFVELIDARLDLPEGLINLVLGDGEVGAAITGHMDVHKVAFTGSTRVGKQIVQQSALSNLKPLSLELGGKSPNIFFADTPDLEQAIERSFQVMFSHKGEKCSEPTRFFVHDGIHDQVLDRLVARAEAIRCGDPFAESTDQGPQCHQAHFDKVMRYIQLGRDEGARLVAGGSRDTSGDNARGLFVRPTIFAGVDNRMTIAQDEIFGPVLTVTRFSTEDEVVAMANDTIYGLAAGVYTENVSRAHRMAARLEAGMIFINRYGCYDFSSPFGGYKQSGWGKEMARESMDAYTRTKSVWLKL